MNKFILTGFLLVLSTAIFADDHLNAAIHEAKAAEMLGQQGKVTKLIRHANMALVHFIPGQFIAVPWSSLCAFLFPRNCEA